MRCNAQDMNIWCNYWLHLGAGSSARCKKDIAIRTRVDLDLEKNLDSACVYQKQAGDYLKAGIKWLAEVPRPQKESQRA